jgi:3-methylfumaryl-CoA hydratase
VTRTENLSPEPAARLAATLDLPLAEQRNGESGTLPLTWHWLYLLDVPTRSDLADDGHRRREVAADDQLTNRMFAGGHISQRHPLRLGRDAEMHEDIVGDEVKQGRSGPLRLVTTRCVYRQDGQDAIIDTRRLVYRRPGPAPTPDAQPTSPVGAEQPGRLVGRFELEPDAALLFRISALTFNTHLIHYDRDFARAQGYPGLVVHGPLQAIAMAAAASGAVDPSGSIEFDYRLIAPLYEGQGLVAEAFADGDSLATRVTDRSGRVTAIGRLDVG